MGEISESPMNLYSFNPDLCPSFLGNNEENGSKEMEDQYPFPHLYCNDFADTSLPNPLDVWHVPSVILGTRNQLGLPHEDGDPIEVPEIPDTCFNYISNLLMEDDSDDRPGATLQDYMAAQASYNKSLDAALHGETCSFLANQFPSHVCQNSPCNCFSDYLNMFSTNPTIDLTYENAANDSNNFVRNSLVGNSGGTSTSDFGSTLNRNLVLGSDGILGSHVAVLDPAPVITTVGDVHQYEQAYDLITNGKWDLVSNQADNQSVRDEHLTDNNLADVQRWDMNMYSNTQFELSPITQNIGIMSSNCSSSSAEDINRMVNSQGLIYRNPEIMQELVLSSDSTGKTRGRKHADVDERENREETGRSHKHSAPSNEVFEQIEKYGDVLLCPEGRSKPAGLCSTTNRTSNSQSSEDQKLQKKDVMNTSKGLRKRGNKSQVVDLKILLTRCAQCVARVDLTGAYEMLKQIRQHSSPYGDCLQRVAHYLANGLEARLEGKGLELTRANEQITPSEVLKANRVYVASVPFKIMSYYTTNKTIARLVEEAPSIHIIDFGIFYGLQWPCIIQNLSKRPNGPPRIRITGIDFPQSGFRPAERVEETGRCLAKYCERYNVPFEYHAIAKKWETIQLEDLKIERNEPLVVNCLYRSHNLFDESVEEHSPRDAFLSLVRKINPDIFMHGVVNSTSSVPFFLNRFKEAMFHYTALFDLFEATMSREDKERLLLESKLYGNQALNVIACESIERFERPETYKQWQVRTQRAGFVEVPLERELLRRARAMVRRNFREEFSYDEDGHWVVQGWKGRILYAISCWKPQQV